MRNKERGGGREGGEKEGRGEERDCAPRGGISPCLHVQKKGGGPSARRRRAHLPQSDRKNIKEGGKRRRCAP